VGRNWTKNLKRYDKTELPLLDVPIVAIKLVTNIVAW